MWDYSDLQFARLSCAHARWSPDTQGSIAAHPTDRKSERQADESLPAARVLSWDDRNFIVLCPFCGDTHRHGNTPFVHGPPDGSLLQDDHGRYTWAYSHPRPHLYNTRVTHCQHIRTRRYVTLFPFEDDSRVTALSFELRQKYDSNGEVIEENFVTVGLASPVLSDEEADSFCEDEVETLGQELQSASFEDGDFHVVMKYELNSEFDEHTELASAMIVSAACTGDAGDLASFLDRSPNRHALIRKQDEKGRSLLHLAVPNGHRDVVEYLIGEGCNTNAVDKQGRTPLMEAALWGHPDLVEMLLDAGADKDKRDKRGMIAGRFAEESARNEKDRHQRSTIKYSEDPFTKKQDRRLIRTLLRHSPPPRPSYQSISAGDLQGAYFHKSPSVGTISLVMPRLGIELFSQRKTAAILFRGVPFPLVAAVSGRTGNPATEFRAPEAGFQMLSEGYWGGSENFGVAADMGFSFPHDARDARGKPGSYYASHAEAQLMCFFVRRNYLFREDRPIKSVLDDPNPPPEPVHDDFLQLFLAQPRKREATIAVSKDPCFS